MSMRIHVNHYYLNMTPCRWPPCHSVHSCTHEGRMWWCSVSLRFPWIHSRIHHFKSSVLA